MRGVKSGSVVYEVLETVYPFDNLWFPKKILFVSEGKNIVTPKDGDIISYESVNYQVDSKCFDTSFDSNGKKIYGVYHAFLREVSDSPSLERRTILNP